MLRIGTTELLLLGAVFLVVFGPSKLPKIGRTIGSGIGEFKKGLKGEDEVSMTEKEGESL